jgi:heterodisulfide reductase subunit C2
MTIRITKEQAGTGILDIVEEISGVDVAVCLQCRRCSNGCPVSAHTESSPSGILKKLQMGAGSEICDDEMIWLCASCETCYARCPMGINGAAVMDALRRLAEDRNAKKPEGNMPLMNKILLATMRMFGRTYDLGAMMFYKVGTATYLRDTEKVPMIMRKRKIALFPALGADRKSVKRIFRKIGARKDTVK